MNKVQRFNLKLAELTARFEDEEAEWEPAFEGLVAWHEDLCTWKDRSKVFNGDEFVQRFKETHVAAGKHPGAIPWALFDWAETASRRKEVRNATLLKGRPEYALNGMAQNPMLPLWHDADEPRFVVTISNTMQLAFENMGQVCFRRFSKTSENWPEIQEHLLMAGMTKAEAPDMTVLWDYIFRWQKVHQACMTGRGVDIAAFLDAVSRIMKMHKSDRYQHLFRHVLPEPPDFKHDDWYESK